MREADGSLTPLEPPPYDQMKPDSYYTDLYLTDKPIRFENHVRKPSQPTHKAECMQHDMKRYSGFREENLLLLGVYGVEFRVVLTPVFPLPAFLVSLDTVEFVFAFYSF